MNKRSIICLSTGTFFTLAVIIDIVLEFFGISLFLFGRRVLSSFLGLFIIFAVISFTAIIFMLINARTDEISSKFRISVKSISIILAVILVVLGSVILLMMNESVVYKNVSDDKRHEVLIETDAMYGGWNVSVYKRYTSFVKTENTSFYIDDMASQDGEISVKWYDDGCDITYDCYSDYGSTDEPQSYTQRVYFTAKSE